MRKLVFFDIDGTLVSYSTNPGHIPPPTKQAVRLLGERGHIVAVATGRSILTARPVMEQLGIPHAVLCGGAHVVSEGQTLLLRCIDQRIADLAAFASVEAGCSVFACSDSLIYLGNCSEDSWDYVRQQTGQPDAARPITQMKDVCMMSIYGERLPDPALLGGASVTQYQSAMEVRPPSVTKASGMELLARRMGVTLRNTVAVGDSENDIEILRAAGVGIAVGNGCEQAKAAADIVAGPIDDGGILAVMQQIGLI